MYSNARWVLADMINGCCQWKQASRKQPGASMTGSGEVANLLPPVIRHLSLVFLVCLPQRVDRAMNRTMSSNDDGSRYLMILSLSVSPNPLSVLGLGKPVKAKRTRFTSPSQARQVPT